ncbi:hypothetical protein Cgig2_006985 [Carnegiea gigantea]|uniref:Uncharacterized protein n=1 Tax=Carnegiea gigantea TaxID=171969 RepID=A0A9Q1KE20_9CARY|nr:hypothetical protein Cgig2_006985 [Carnegiea gigantea]
MKLKSLFAFKANIIDPCSKLLSKFKNLKPSIKNHKRSSVKPHIKFTKSLGLSQCRPKNKLRYKSTFQIRSRESARLVKKSVPKVRVAELLTVLFSLRKAKDIEDEGGNPIMADATMGKGPFPSPITPLFARNSGASKKETSGDVEDVEESCRSFETYLVDMIVEEGKFYGQLCKDLFSPSEEAESQETTTSE